MIPLHGRTEPPFLGRVKDELPFSNKAKLLLLGAGILIILALSLFLFRLLETSTPVLTLDDQSNVHFVLWNPNYGTDSQEGMHPLQEYEEEKYWLILVNAQKSQS